MKDTILALFAKIFPKPMKSEELVKEDRISALPDCLIVEILARLPSTKDAIRTGTLSKRWEHLWTWVPTLIFKHPAAEFRQDPNSLSEFVSFVDKTLSQCRQLNLKKFTLDIICDRQFESQFNSWVGYAISRNVSELKLRFEMWVVLDLDQSFFVSSYFTHLTLVRCILNPSGAISWKNLRSLCIKSACIKSSDEGLIHNILSGSPQLETLEFNSSYKRLNITSQSLKKLVISGCPNFVTSVVEINAPNLKFLTIRNDLMAKILLQNVSSLGKAYLDLSDAVLFYKVHIAAEAEELKGLILKLGHIKELQIAVLYPEALDHLEAKWLVFPCLLEEASGLIITRLKPKICDALKHYPLFYLFMFVRCTCFGFRQNVIQLTV